MSNPVKITTECWSPRKDSSGTCCKWDCMYLGRIMMETVAEGENIASTLSSKCHRYGSALNISFGRPKKCFECMTPVPYEARIVRVI